MGTSVLKELVALNARNGSSDSLDAKRKAASISYLKLLTRRESDFFCARVDDRVVAKGLPEVIEAKRVFVKEV
jgi:hypothetical protein